MKVSIIGVGAMGSLIAVKLIQARIQVQLVFKNTDQLRKSVIINAEGTTSGSVFLSDNVMIDQIDGDIILICTKSTANNALFKQLSFLKDKTIILLQSGIGEEASLLKVLHRSNVVISAVTDLKVSKKAETVTVHNNAYNVYYSVCKGGLTPRVEKFFNGVFEEITYEPDLLKMRLNHLLNDAGYNGVAVLFLLDTFSLVKDEKALAMMKEISQEIMAIARTYEITLPKLSPEILLEKFSQPAYQSVYFSMYADYRNQKPMEVDLYRGLLGMAQKKQIKTPVINEMAQQLKRLEKSSIQIEAGLKLRLLGPADLKNLHQLVLNNQDHLKPWHAWANKDIKISDAEFVMRSGHQKFLNNNGGDFGLFYNEKQIGMLSFHHINHALKSSAIGYWLSKEHTGKGIMTKAVKVLIQHGFENLKLKVIEIKCARENIKSQKVAERLAFTFDQILPMAEQVRDKCYDHFCYKLVRPESM